MKLPRGLERLRAALGRHGVVSLCAIVGDALRQGGPGVVFRMLAQDQAFLSLARPPAKDRAPSWPPVLDSAGAVSAATWRRWVHHPAADRKPAYAAPIAFVLADGPGGPVQRERLAAIAPGAVVLQAPPDEPDLATLYLFLEPEDIPLPELAAEVRAALNGQVEVVTFDLFRRQDDFVAPCMVPGANLARFQEDDRLYRRGAATAAFLRATSGQSPNAGLRERITYWSQTRSPSNIRAGWRHLGAPLVEAAGPQVNPAFRPRSPNTRTLHFSAGASAIICTRDKGHLTRQLVRQLLRLDDAQLSDVVILSNQTTNPYALQTLADLSSDSRVQILRRDEPFNFSRLCNIGVEHSRGNGPLLFLNDDVAPISEDWLQTLLARLQVPGTGAVGPLLLYPDETVQHAGMYLRLPKGAGHVLRGARLPEDDPLGLAAAPREVSCLTGAVLLTDRAAFQQIGGFDEALALSFQDVDYGLKLHQAGLRNIFEPRAVLLHMESVSLKTASVDPAAALQKHQEWRLFVDRWSSSFPQDPFYPAALDLDDERSRRLAPGGPWGKGPWSKR